MNDILLKLNNAKKYYVLSEPKFPRFKRNLILLYKSATTYQEISLFYMTINTQIFKKYSLYAIKIYTQLLKYNLKKKFRSEILSKLQNLDLQMRYF